MDRRTFVERTKLYFGHTDPSRYIARSWVRLLISLFLPVGIAIGLILLGAPDVGFTILFFWVIGLFRVAYLIVRPRHYSSRREPGWRMDPLGDYRWWNGSAFTDPPPGETPRKIGPEIEW
jgi:hypothetical protein